MKNFGILLAAALLLAPACARADDPFANWTDTQLKVKILQLQGENAELRSKLKSVSVEAAPTQATADLLLDDFEGSTASNGRAWWDGCDSKGLGTTLEPQPFVAQQGGCPSSPGHCGRIHGHYGRNQAPWPWAALALPLADGDIRGYSALSFYVKGNGGHYRVQLCRGAVKDFAYPEAGFDAPARWTLVRLPLSNFVQPSWGLPLPANLKDVEKISFGPTTPDQDYDLSIDDVILLK